MKLKEIDLKSEVICIARCKVLPKAWWVNYVNELTLHAFTLTEIALKQHMTPSKQRKTRFQLTVWIVDDHYIQELNKNYRAKPNPTDVLSFPGSLLSDWSDLTENPSIVTLGDIFISRDRLLSQAKEYGHTPQREGAFLFVHGLLHLLGYDHQTKKQERLMRNLQDKILRNVFPRD
ncbi:MAG: rRNA maturation RNase YbeY [Candidatus Caenarcaniphilales bacterium]|nr:rRNA maturation RNase YbeY [Candidatus Caenarcaniphilales bacterium]